MITDEHLAFQLRMAFVGGLTTVMCKRFGHIAIHCCSFGKLSEVIDVDEIQSFGSQLEWIIDLVFG